MKTSARKIPDADWSALAAQLDEFGYALTGPLLTKEQCTDLIRLYSEKSVFRSRIVMERLNFGRGEYQYFRDPLPALVQRLRETFYPPLADIANRWAARLNRSDRFPETLASFLEVCRGKQQALPTPLMLRYQAGDYNCLHQDLYGEISFPLQAACVLTQQGHDYTGGEFLLTQQRPRMQTRGEAITAQQGEFVIFPNQRRPVAGKRGDYRVNIRHGVSRLKSGERYSLGLIFHNAK